MKPFILSGLLFLLLLSCGRTKKPSEATTTEPGKEVYMKYCLACHQMDGSGVPGMYPTLQKTDWVQGDKTRLISLILDGQQGEIIVNDQVFKGVMPAHQYLTDEQIADVLTYIRSNYGNNADPVTPAEVARLRSNQTGQNLNSQTVSSIVAGGILGVWH